jgi:hypothetical protein
LSTTKSSKEALASFTPLTKPASSFSQYLHELQGIADGAEVDFWKLLYFNLPELSDSYSGCASIASREANQILLVHNEDSVAEERLQDGFLVHYALPTVSFYAFVYAGTGGTPTAFFLHAITCIWGSVSDCVTEFHGHL